MKNFKDDEASKYFYGSQDKLTAEEKNINGYDFDDLCVEGDGFYYCFEPLKTYKVMATIKKHETYKDVCQTTVNRMSGIVPKKYLKK